MNTSKSTNATALALREIEKLLQQSQASKAQSVDYVPQLNRILLFLSGLPGQDTVMLLSDGVFEIHIPRVAIFDDCPLFYHLAQLIPPIKHEQYLIGVFNPQTCKFWYDGVNQQTSNYTVIAATTATAMQFKVLLALLKSIATTLVKQQLVLYNYDAAMCLESWAGVFDINTNEGNLMLVLELLYACARKLLKVPYSQLPGGDSVYKYYKLLAEWLMKLFVHRNFSYRSLIDAMDRAAKSDTAVSLVELVVGLVTDPEDLAQILVKIITNGYVADLEELHLGANIHYRQLRGGLLVQVIVAMLERNAANNSFISHANYHRLTGAELLPVAGVLLRHNKELDYELHEKVQQYFNQQHLEGQWLASFKQLSVATQLQLVLNRKLVATDNRCVEIISKTCVNELDLESLLLIKRQRIEVLERLLTLAPIRAKLTKLPQLTDLCRNATELHQAAILDQLTGHVEQLVLPGVNIIELITLLRCLIGCAQLKLLNIACQNKLIKSAGEQANLFEIFQYLETSNKLHLLKNVFVKNTEGLFSWILAHQKQLQLFLVHRAIKEMVGDLEDFIKIINFMDQGVAGATIIELMPLNDQKYLEQLANNCDNLVKLHKCYLQKLSSTLAGKFEVEYLIRTIQNAANLITAFEQWVQNDKLKFDDLLQLFNEKVIRGIVGEFDDLMKLLKLAPVDKQTKMLHDLRADYVTPTIKTIEQLYQFFHNIAPKERLDMVEYLGGEVNLGSMIARLTKKLSNAEVRSLGKLLAVIPGSIATTTLVDAVTTKNIMTNDKLCHDFYDALGGKSTRELSLQAFKRIAIAQPLPTTSKTILSKLSKPERFRNNTPLADAMPEQLPSLPPKANLSGVQIQANRLADAMPEQLPSLPLKANLSGVQIQAHRQLNTKHVTLVTTQPAAKVKSTKSTKGAMSEDFCLNKAPGK